MNPWTLITLWSALADGEKHLIDLQCETRLHHSTIYAAVKCGWLKKTEPAHFSATERLVWEVKQYESMSRACRATVK